MEGVLRRFYKKLRFGGTRFRCIVCGSGVRIFFRFSTSLEQMAKDQGFPYDFKRVETLNYAQCNCPFCLASDRERLYLIFFERYFQSRQQSWRILDFAPADVFSRNLRARKNVDYVSADLFRDDVDVKLDVCRMESIRDGEFDVVICSHILEHVDNPESAVSEIKRVLAPNGIAIIMVPIFYDVTETVSDPAHSTKELRLRHYGQHDHVRIFARDQFIHLLESAGLVVDQVKTTDLDRDLLKQNAIAADSVLYVVSKSGLVR